MAVEIKIPSVGESITEGTLARWLKKDGATVAADEPLFELETDKATTEIPAPAAGVLRITVAEGEKVAIGSVVGRIEEAPLGKAAAAAAPRPRTGAARRPRRDAPEDDRPAPPHCGAAGRVATDHRHPHDLQRGRPVRRDGAAQQVQGRLQAEAQRRPRVHGVLREGGG